jgi:hypothetical protein
MREAGARGAYTSATTRGPAAAESAQRVQRARARADKPRQHERTALAELDLRVRRLLARPQREVVEHYASCLIPAPEQKDPTRVGQANDRDGKNEAAVRQARNQRAPPAAAAALAASVATELGHHGRTLSPTEQERLGKELQKVATRLLAMDEVEFALSGEDLSRAVEEAEAAALRADDPKRRPTTPPSRQEETERPAWTKVGGFLLDDRVGELMARCLQRSKTFQPLPATDLDAIEAAPHCVDGKCAVD